MLDTWGLLELLRILFRHGDSDDFDSLHGRKIRITFAKEKDLESPFGFAPSRPLRMIPSLEGWIHSPHTYQSGCLGALTVQNREGRYLVPLHDLIAKDTKVEIDLEGLDGPRPKTSSDEDHLDSESLLKLIRTILDTQKRRSLCSRHIRLELPVERSLSVFRGKSDSVFSIGLVESIEGTIVDFFSMRADEAACLVVQLQGQEWRSLLHPRDLIERGAKVRLGLGGAAKKTQG